MAPVPILRVVSIRSVASGKLSKAASAVEKTDKESDNFERESKEDSGGGGSFDVPGWLCPTRWC